MTPTILIIEDEKHTREGLEEVLGGGFEVFVARDADEGFRLMEAETFDVILTDLRMAGKNGMSVIDYAMKLANKPICIMMTAYGDVETAVEAMKRGAYDFLTKPIDIAKLEVVIKHALKDRESDKNAVVKVPLKTATDVPLDGIIGGSEGLKRVMEQVRQVAPSRATILLQGETGTGKELVATALHRLSNREKQPFVAVHCAALPSALLESELFGHERGAFTGAVEKRIGRFERADKGTLFLDEIGEIDATTQVKLLRFLETRGFERVGGHQWVQVDVRLICATHCNLAQMVKEGTFREDLYYRLNVVKITVPPLRERKDDIAPLLKHYIKLFSAENGVKPIQLTDNALRILGDYAWPGNIRELRNFAENAVVTQRSGIVDTQDLDGKFFFTETTEIDTKNEKTFGVEDREKRLLKGALLKAGGNRTLAAEMLEISRRTLHRKLKQWPEITGEP
jgi:two-component system, NtrC family, response regulator AtoC